MRLHSTKARSWTRTGVGVELGSVDVADNILDGLDVAVPYSVSRPGAANCRYSVCSTVHIHLKVTTDEELATHFGG